MTLSKPKHHKIEASFMKEASKFNIKKILMALSGGPDSIAAIFALKQCGLEIEALHCNFHLRGFESDRDMDFVILFCKKNKIPLRTIDFDIEEYRKKHHGESVEMACRNLRYHWFYEVLKETGSDRIVTGHNSDDNIETFLLNMLRGSGSRGLSAMATDNGRIWRPLLNFTKKEILDYLKINNLSFVIDSTNLSSDFRRNYLRNEIIPLFRKEWNGFDSTMNRNIKNLRAENLIIESSLNNILKENKTCLSVKTILEYPAPLLLIKRFIDPIGPFISSPEEIMSAIEAQKPHIRQWQLKNGKVILRNGRLIIC